MFVVLIFSSIIPASNDLNPTFVNKEDPILFIEDNKDSPLSSSLNDTDFITGPSVNQTVRVYMNNKSSSINSQNGYFDIATPTDNMNLSSGLFEFNFGNNFTTDYIIEGDNALYPDIIDSYFEIYTFDSVQSYLTINEGTGNPVDVYAQLTDGNPNSYRNITSSAGGLVNITISANFSGVSGFNRNNIIAFILNFTYGLNKDADVTLKMKDFFDTGDFKEILTLSDVNSTLSPHDIDELFANENFNFINESDSCLLQFIFDRSKFVDKDFNVSLYEFNLRSFRVLELNITNQNYVALELQLKGLNSTINGFYAWIRTLDKILAQNSNLTITLCRANDTISESQRTNPGLIEPDLISGEIYSRNFTNYDKDTLFYFEFDNSQTNNLNRSNYFIIINSNRPEAVYSIVTIPLGDWGDESEKDHYFLQTNDQGNSWSEARSPLPGEPSTYPLDVSQFKLDITRGYITSDFNSSLKIQEKKIKSFSIPFSGAPDLEWGLGKWDNSFTYPIGSESNNFQIDLTWNFTETIIRGFKFDVNYTVEAFRTENATTTYFANYDLAPQWIFNYSLGLSDSKFDTWNFTKIMFIYQDYFTAQNLLIPDFTQALNQTDDGGETD